MNKIIPILSLVIAALCALCAIIGLIMVSVSVSVAELGFVSVPTAIAGGIASAFSVGINIIFYRDKLCRIALFIDIGALALSIVSIMIWFMLLRIA